jgi:hypothetical protein
VWSLNCFVDLLNHLTTREVKEPQRVLKAIIRECDKLSPESLYVLRVMLIMSLFTLGDIQLVFKVFLRLIAQVVHEVTRVNGLAENRVEEMISQLVISLSNGESGDKLIRSFTSFLERVLRRVPEIVVPDDVNLQPIQMFIDQHNAEVSAEIRKFMDQKPDCQVLVFSFAQNIRFLANMQRMDRSLWIPLP